MGSSRVGKTRVLQVVERCPAIRGIFFDLDNTLYDEWQYYSCGFQAVSAFLSNLLFRPSTAIYEALVREFDHRGRTYPYLFDRVLEGLGSDDPTLVREVLSVFREVRPTLSLYPGVRTLLKELQRLYRLALITNGHVASQQRKVKSLDIEELFDVIVYARARGPEGEKPNISGFEEALRALSLKPEEAVYVGDNPFTDFAGPRKLGMFSIRVLTGAFARTSVAPEHEADLQIEDLKELPQALQCTLPNQATT